MQNEISNTIETKFASASAGTAFVAAGILQLIERGRIKFDDTLGMLLDIPLNDIDKDVTVKQLLTHTSGVPDYFDETVMNAYEEYHTTDWIIMIYPAIRTGWQCDCPALFIRNCGLRKGTLMLVVNSIAILYNTINKGRRDSEIIRKDCRIKKSKWNDAGRTCSNM